MSTQQETSSNNQSNLQFNPLAQSAYNQLVGSGSNVLQGYMNNPFGNASYQLGLGQSMRGASQSGANNQGVLNQLMKSSGIGGQAGQGFMGAQQAQLGRANQSQMSQANLGNIQSALQRQMAATGMGMSFSPQMTGQSGTSSSTQSTGGLGTWLPQLLGSAAGMAMGGMGGGGFSQFASPTGGSVGNTSNPSLMSPAYMGFGGGSNPAPTAGLNPLTLGMMG